MVTLSSIKALSLLGLMTSLSTAAAAKSSSSSSKKSKEKKYKSKKGGRAIGGHVTQEQQYNRCEACVMIVSELCMHTVEFNEAEKQGQISKRSKLAGGFDLHYLETSEDICNRWRMTSYQFPPPGLTPHCEWFQAEYVDDLEDFFTTQRKYRSTARDCRPVIEKFCETLTEECPDGEAINADEHSYLIRADTKPVHTKGVAPLNVVRTLYTDKKKILGEFRGYEYRPRAQEGNDPGMRHWNGNPAKPGVVEGGMNVAKDQLKDPKNEGSGLKYFDQDGDEI